MPSMQDSYFYDNIFAFTNSVSNTLATDEKKANQVNFLEEDCSTLAGFHED
jgi:hypothetical protein